MVCSQQSRPDPTRLRRRSLLSPAHINYISYFLLLTVVRQTTTLDLDTGSSFSLQSTTTSTSTTSTITRNPSTINNQQSTIITPSFSTTNFLAALPAPPTPPPPPSIADVCPPCLPPHSARHGSSKTATATSTPPYYLERTKSNNTAKSIVRLVFTSHLLLHQCCIIHRYSSLLNIHQYTSVSTDEMAIGVAIIGSGIFATEQHLVSPLSTPPPPPPPHSHNIQSDPSSSLP